MRAGYAQAPGGVAQFGFQRKFLPPMTSLPLPPEEEKPRPKKPRIRPDAAALYPIVKTRVSPAEQKQFQDLAEAAGKKPGTLLRELVQAHIAGGVMPVRDRETGTAKKIAPAANAELERFELRLAAFMKTEVKRRAHTEEMSSSEWVAALIQTVLMNDPVLTDREIEIVSYANRALAALGRNLNQIARSMNRAELTYLPLSEKEKLTLKGIAELKGQIGKLRENVLSLVHARNRAWGVEP